MSRLEADIQARLDEIAKLIGFLERDQHDAQESPARRATGTWPQQISALKEEARALKLQLSQASDQAAAVAAADAAARRSAEDARAQEESAFWFRRFFTTLAIANGAGFVALANGFLQADNRAELAVVVTQPMSYFAAGMFAAGLMPILLWSRLALDRNARILETPAWSLHIGHGLLAALMFGAIVISVGALIIATDICIGAIRTFGA